VSSGASAAGNASAGGAGGATNKATANGAPAATKAASGATVVTGASPGAGAAVTGASPVASNSRAPAAVPAPASVASIPALPTAQPELPPASTIVPAPAPSSEPLPPPVRLVFDSGQSELTPDNQAAIRDLAHSIPAQAVSSINVMAYAAGKSDDPSTARRLSLSRGMAVRSVLLASGVPSAQIYVRALGSTATDGPADQVELVVARIGTVTR
jgi:outer membrane protein OmpA-like peptidoglycan-associated protein